MADASFSYKKYQYIIYLYYHSLDSDSSSIDTYYFIHLFYTNLIIAFLFFGKNCLTAPPPKSAPERKSYLFFEWKYSKGKEEVLSSFFTHLWPPAIVMAYPFGFDHPLCHSFI